MRVREQRWSVERAGGVKRECAVELPVGHVGACALLVHAFPRDETAARLGRALARRGIATLRLDVASGEAPFGVDDLLAAAALMRERVGAPRLLVGHSLGGAAVLAAAHLMPEVSAVATVAAPCGLEHLAGCLAEPHEPGRRDGAARVVLEGRGFEVERALLDELALPALTERVRALHRALLVLHAPFDKTVGIEEASCLFMAARHPRSFISLDQADHALSKREDALYAAESLGGWASRYLGLLEEEADEGPHADQHGVVTVTEDRLGRYSQDVEVGSHRFKADEPPSVGGEDVGPAPYEWLLAALGACTSMTLRMYAERKELPLERISVRMKHHKRPVAEVPEARTASGAVDVIEREITLEGPLEPDVRARMLEIADRCPVHRSLHSEIITRSRLVEEVGSDGEDG